MITLFNLTTSLNDMERFQNRAELLALMEGFDGVELLVCEPDERNIVPESGSSAFTWATFRTGSISGAATKRR